LQRRFGIGPVEVVATGPKALEMGGRIADRVALNIGVDPARVAWAIETVRAGARKAGRDPASIGTPETCVARLRVLHELGVDRFVVTSTTADMPDYDRVRRAVVEQVLPGCGALRRASTHRRHDATR
jgi:alkanesulfonate monooxygenase SsuD/methylene tetrahydromethanopterin reductase-like flavin-dependent oxidoreductase (luciferase family)